jgi:hypothetical protein
MISKDITLLGTHQMRRLRLNAAQQNCFRKKDAEDEGRRVGRPETLVEELRNTTGSII